MKMKQAFLAVPLSFSLLIPTFSVVSADDHGSHGNAHMSAEVSNPAIDLRASLDAILSEHAFLAVVAMQKGIDGKEDFEAAAGQLNQNTEKLSAAVASVYGEEAGAQFKEIWSSHIGYFVDYVTATAENNEEGRKQALAELDGYRVKQADLLDKATEGRLKAKDLEEGLKVHVDQLIWAFESYRTGDYDKAYDSISESMHHMFGTSKGLSWAITDQFPEKFENKSVDTPAADLRSDLNSVFSAHAALAALTMQKGIDGAKDFEAAAKELGENTDDITAAVESVYGAEGAAKFKEIWSSHIGYFVDYVTATAEKNEEGKKQAVAELDEYRVQQAAFLDAATEGRLKAAELEEGLKVHVDQLLMAFNSYTGKDYPTAYKSISEAYGHMFGVGQAMSGAIVDQFPEKFAGEKPSEMPKTGMGGMSQTNNDAILWSLFGLILASVTAAMIVRKKATNNE
ncbi:copper amine oxidase [Fictibacillus nanhaiensis]|uniref:copper amine oxidase n=1 Tax=Fictibacillus nanhaiensis TaxID=742169 RepID=UPI001C94F66D|nr:copper amine oxidase [Fictibacillus nanhaiensis]MBY6037349.1 copper amine oxidase [Fictibacillus nanhaiensis]